MAITSTCPGCGATLLIDENQGSITCHFCGNHFNVNLEETAPALNKTVPPAEPAASSAQPTPPEAYKPPIPGAASTAGDDVYNPPIPGAPTTAREDVYNPPLEDISSGSSQTYSPPPFSSPEEPPLITRLTSNRLWVAIAIAVTVIFCISCLCMAVISRTIVGGLFQ